MRVFEQVRSVRRFVSALAVLSVVAAPAVAGAQTPATRGRLIVTVADPSGAIVPAATVTITGGDAATKAATILPVKSGSNGLATFEGLELGRYTIGAEFPGFEPGLLRDVRVNRGDNRHVVTCR